MKSKNEYLICLIPPDSPQWYYWSGHGFHYIGVANRYKSPRSANTILQRILDPNVLANDKLPDNWQGRGYKLEVRHESAALSSDAVLGGSTTAQRPKEGDLVLGSKTRVDRAISLCKDYSVKAAFLAKKFHNQYWTLTSRELLKLVDLLKSQPDFVYDIEKAFELRNKALPVMERTPEWQMFREVEANYEKAIAASCDR